MHHLIATKTIVADGELVLELRGKAVRIKRRGMPELFLPLDAARDVGRFLLDAAAAGRSEGVRGLSTAFT